MVMQGVVEEKTNRIVEVLASSATPFQIMFGKVVGIGVVGLTQVILWVILCGAVLFGVGMAVTPSPEMADTMMQVQNMGMNTGGGMNTDQMADIMNSVASLHITFWHILVFVFYFLSGYFIFATLFAAIGVTVDSPTESNNLAAPLSMLIIIPILLINYVVVQPEATLSVVTSLFPFFAPILMVARVITISVPVWQIVLSVALQIVTFVLCLKFAGKIYRMGMLKYGKKTTFKDLFVWLKTK
jgi:ABC-2 type transport system permease protein